ncbi:hypothetical protein RI129_001783 [Pyrocoelia pectoralis]|uniref:THAP-type domain-containing protein n=1 Tax=Pyrocoelia pectoralis TaxID=417401 RepID=A0AAN7VVB4_9COLE
MVRYCSAFACTNEWKPNAVYRFHTFPMKRPEILKLWVQAVRLKDFKPSKNTVLCSEHFTDDCYLESSLHQNLLKKDAVPSIFKFPEDLCKKVSVRRELVRQPTISTIQAQIRPSTSRMQMEITEPVSCTSEIGTQTSPRHLKKSDTEIELKRRLKILQRKLNRRDSKIKNMKELIKYLKVNNKSNSNLEDVMTIHFQ